MIGIFNRRFNPLYAIGERAFYAYLSANSHDWRGAFRHGTVAVVLSVLAVVTMGKGLSGALKKGSAGNGAAHAGAAEEAATQKAVPNPHGKLGGPAHRAKVAEVVADIDKRGLRPAGEHGIETPGGHKPKRYVDVVGIDPQSKNVVEMHQIGRQTKGGQPVSREVRAMDDIEAVEGKRPIFHPYNK